MFLWHWGQQHESALDKLAKHLRLLGRSPKTVEAYVGGLRGFLRKTTKDVDDLSSEDVYNHLVYLREDRELAGSTINQRRAALRIFFEEVLERPLPKKVIKYSKRPKRTPEALSQSEITALFQATENLKTRTIFMTMYSAGLRVSEATHLKPSDIDSKDMRIHIRAGKGNKDRQVMLSERLLESLRDYWRLCRPKEWLFPSPISPQPISSTAVQKAFRKAAKKAGIQKHATTHSLRHSFAIHLLEAGTSLRYIQELLGHASIQSTMVYLKAVPESADVKSPLDRLQI